MLPRLFFAACKMLDFTRGFLLVTGEEAVVAIGVSTVGAGVEGSTGVGLCLGGNLVVDGKSSSSSKSLSSLIWFRFFCLFFFAFRPWLLGFLGKLGNPGGGLTLKPWMRCLNNCSGEKVGMGGN